jgi:4-carboxymuconolactone decarboxylase
MTSDEQHERGLQQLRALAGPDAEAAVERNTALAPDLGRWIVDFVFGEVYSRPGLDLRTRQIVNVAALAALGTATPQLEAHLRGALNVGVTKEELIEIILHLAVYAGFPASLNGIAALERVLAAREAAAAPPPPGV